MALPQKQPLPPPEASFPTTASGWGVQIPARPWTPLISSCRKAAEQGKANRGQLSPLQFALRCFLSHPLTAHPQAAKQGGSLDALTPTRGFSFPTISLCVSHWLEQYLRLVAKMEKAAGARCPQPKVFGVQGWDQQCLPASAVSHNPHRKILIVRVTTSTSGKAQHCVHRLCGTSLSHRWKDLTPFWGCSQGSGNAAKGHKQVCAILLPFSWLFSVSCSCSAVKGCSRGRDQRGWSWQAVGKGVRIGFFTFSRVQVLLMSQ